MHGFGTPHGRGTIAMDIIGALTTQASKAFLTRVFPAPYPPKQADALANEALDQREYRGHIVDTIYNRRPATASLVQAALGNATKKPGWLRRKLHAWWRHNPLRDVRCSAEKVPAPEPHCQEISHSTVFLSCF